MPVPLKYMYTVKILRNQFTSFVPTYAPMWYTIIKPKLSSFKSRSENSMLTSTVLSYFPLFIKRLSLPRSPQIFLRLFTEKINILLTPCIQPKISQHSYTSYNAWRKQCVLANYHQNYNIPVFFIIRKKQKRPYKAVICVRAFQSVTTPIGFLFI